MKVQINLYLFIIFIAPILNISSKFEARYSSSNFGVNNKFSHHSFQNECQSQRLSKHLNQHIVRQQEEQNNNRNQAPDQKQIQIINNSDTTKIKLENIPKVNTKNPDDREIINKFQEYINTTYPRETQEQEISSQKITLFLNKALELLKSPDKISQAYDMLAISSFAHKLNKQKDFWAVSQLLDEYLESVNLISQNWTDNQERKNLNTKLVNTANAIAYADIISNVNNSSFDNKIPESLISCAGLTTSALRLNKNENIPINISQKLSNLSDNLIYAGMQLAKISISTEKRGLYLAFNYFLDPAQTSLKLFYGAVKGAANAIKNFNPVKIIREISSNTKDGIKFLASFTQDLNLDHKTWLDKYNCAERVLEICNSIENATTEEIGQILGQSFIDQVMFDKTLKIIGKSLSILAASVKRTINSNTKIQEVLSTLKESPHFSKPNLEILASTENGTEIMVFSDAAQEITKDLNNLNNTPTLPAEINPITQTLKLTEFQSEVAQLTEKYGLKILEDAQQALRINEYKILNNNVSELLNKLEKLSQDIKYITESKPHRLGFIYDAANGGKVSEGSILEALAGCVAEDLNIVEGPLIRAQDLGYDFVDILGNKWDVKTPFSKAVNFPGKKFNAEKFLEESIRKTINSGELVLLDTTYLIESDIQDLMNLLLKEENLLLKTKVLSRKILKD